MIAPNPLYSCLLILLVSTSLATAQTASGPEVHLALAEGFKKSAQADSAIIYYEKAAAGFRSPADRENRINAYNQLGILLTRQDQYGKAKAYLDKAVATGLSLPDSNNLTLATTYIAMGVIYNAEGNYDQSLLYHNRSLSIRLKQLGEYHADVATSYGNIGNVWLNRKDFDNSITAHLKAMTIREKLFGKSGTEVTQSYTHLGRAHREKKDYPTSRVYFEKALQNKILQLGQGHKDLAVFYKNLSEVCYLMGDRETGDLYKSSSESVSKS